MLVQQWVTDAYRTLKDRRGWTWATIQGQLVWQDARTFDVTVTVGSTQVTSAGLFLAADQGRQLRSGTYPIYTVATVIDANTITLDLPYQGPASGVVFAQILDAYVTMPGDFGRFVVVCDPINQRLVPWWATWEEMTIIDPIRAQTANTPRLLGARAASDYDPTLGQISFEYYPKPTVAGALQYYAIGAPMALAQDYVFPGLLGTRPDILRTGALAHAALWPGTAEQKNPYFNLGLASALAAKFETLCNQLDIRDDDVYQQSVDNLPWQRWRTWAWTYDCAQLQMSDATLASYAGYGWWGPW